MAVEGEAAIGDEVSTASFPVLAFSVDELIVEVVAV
jgi:hypothetical protein